MSQPDRARYALAQAVALRAGRAAYDMFKRREELIIESKGLQDMVSAADRETEQVIRDEVAAAFPDDGFLGEEAGMDRKSAEYLWVVDPIDGTACFVNGMHSWCLSVGVIRNGKPIIGVVYDPNSEEMFHACDGEGAFVNDKPITILKGESLRDGVMGVGFSHRRPVSAFIPFLDQLLSQGGMFIRNGSGALMMAYVAAGRLIGYYEPHIHAWDCLAGIVLVKEAGGVTNDFLADDGLTRGNPILAASHSIYASLLKITGAPELETSADLDIQQA